MVQEQITGVIGEEEIRKFERESYDDIKSMEVGNLLGEDVERSRNAMLLATFFAVSIHIFDITEIELLGAKIGMSTSGNIILSAFLIATVVALSLFHWINVRSDIVAKEAHQSALSTSLRSRVRQLKKAAVGLEADKDETNADYAKKLGKKLDWMDRSISRQRSFVVGTSATISIACPLFVALAAWSHYFLLA